MPTSSTTGAERFDPNQPQASHGPEEIARYIQLFSEAEIAIPGPRFTSAGVLGVIALTFVLLLTAGAILPTHRGNLASRDLPLAYLFITLLLAVALMVGLANLLVGSRRRRTTVKASPAGLVIERRGTWRTRVQEVSASEIVDIDQSTFEHVLESTRSAFATAKSPNVLTHPLLERLGKWTLTNGIVVKSRREVITFGEGLPANELKYVRWVLRRALAGF